MKTFRELIVWQKAIVLTKSIYDLTSNLPSEENYGLKSQLRRAAVSVPSNIAEGSKRHNRKEFIQFCAIAKGSAAEIETQLVLSKEIYQLDVSRQLLLLEEVQKMLQALTKSLATNSKLPTTN